MSQMSRRYTGLSVPPRLAPAVEQIRAMAAHPGIEVRITWVEELPARDAAGRLP